MRFFRVAEQTVRNFMTRLNEHLQAFHYNNCNSNFSKHLLENQQPADTTDNTMEILFTRRKGSHFNTTEKYYIYVEITRQAMYVKCNTEECLCNHTCSGKAISITYILGVCNLRYPACNVHAPYCHLWPVWLYHISLHYLINGTI